MDTLRRMFSSLSSTIRSSSGSTWEATCAITRFLSLVYVTAEYGVNMTVCVGPSMLPTMRQDGDTVNNCIKWADYAFAHAHTLGSC